MTRVRRRTALWVVGAAALVIGVVLAALDRPLWDAGGPGIIGYELAGSEDRADDILAEWGEDGRSAAKASLWLDYLYLAAYGAFWALAAAAVRDLSRRRGWRRFARLGSLAVPLAVAAAAFDALENTCLLLVLGGNGGSVAPVAATVFATLKFVSSSAVVAYILVALLRAAHARRPGLTRALGVACLVLLVGLLGVNTWTIERETRAAEADGGRIIGLPDGDIHVREDGSPTDPPLLLIHGLGISMRWWEGLVPELAREHRVIRVDLLGHGGSEKPRGDYSMERQADLIAQVLDRLGVERAAVVGHSLGGIVGAALVERHGERVSRLMTIGTPTDLGPGRFGLDQRIALWPVTGHAVRRLAPDYMVRAEVEETMEPEVDLPDRLAEDINRTTFYSLRESAVAGRDYRKAKPLDDRLADSGVPLTIVYGKLERVVGLEAADRWRDVPGARLLLLEGVGHNPQLEDPEGTTRLILEFAR